eukprot:5324148-Pyramimonas_sp.AAC.1
MVGQIPGSALDQGPFPKLRCVSISRSLSPGGLALHELLKMPLKSFRIAELMGIGRWLLSAAP